MASAPPPRSYRSARDRVAQRRARNQRAAAVSTSRRTRSGCSSIIAGSIAALLLTGLVIFVLTGFATRTLDTIQQADPRLHVERKSAAVQEPLPRADLEPFTILLLGVDTRTDEAAAPRSDTLIVVHVNPQQKWASMLSIPRDSMVEIPYVGYQKINAAYPIGYLDAEAIYGPGTAPAAGGAALAAETVERFLGIPVDYTAQVDFLGFERLIDIMGGLVIDVPKPLLDAEYPTENFGFERLYIPAGLQVFDGATALRYARSRHSDSDFDRSCRQQRVLRAMLRQARSQDVLDQAARLPELVKNLEQSVSTTLPISELGVLYSLADFARSLNTDSIIQLSINPDNVRMNVQGSDIYWDPYDVQRLVSRMMAGPATNDDGVVTIQVRNGAGVVGLAGQVTRMLASEGQTMLTPADAPRRYTRTTIIDYTGNVAAREQLAELLGLPQSQIRSAPDETDPPAQNGVDLVLVVGEDYDEAWTVVRPNAPTPEPPPPAALPVAGDAGRDLPNLPEGCSPDF